jgi:hypothetical protein
MCGNRQRTRILPSARGAVIVGVLVCLFLLAIGAPVSVFAAEDSTKNSLPAPGFAPGWIRKDRVALYNRDTLFDHINGEAELYFPYGFDMLATATYVNKKYPEAGVVVDVYRMGSLLDAFGIYSNYRKADGAGIVIGAEGFVSSSQLMFYQDRYFVRIQVTGATSLDQELFVACGRAVSRNLPPNSGRPGELGLLAGVPGVVPRSERYLARSLLGYAFFRRGMIADAILGDERVQIFVIFENSPAGARKAFDDYRSYLKAEGQGRNVAGITGRLSLTAVDPLYGGVFVEQSGRYLIGVVRMQEVPAAKRIVDQLRERLFTSQAGPASKITETKIIKYVPLLPAAARAGYCWTNSNVIHRSDAWRCMIGNEIFDPCYTLPDKTTIVCGARPDIDKPSGFILKLTQPLPTPDIAKISSSSASMIELEDGTICDFISGASGATDGVRSERINYSCRVNSQHVVVFGDLQPGTVWIAEKGMLVEQKTRDDLPPFMVKDLRKISIRTVWQ